MTPQITWRCVAFPELTPLALYRVLRARQEVFVVEQQCVFLDADGVDECCWHVLGWDLCEAADCGRLLAYARLVPPGLKHDEASIGRVLTVGTARGVGLGRRLMHEALDQCEQRWPAVGLRISAQHRLRGFYAGLGFVEHGEPYDEDGIAHVHMVRRGGACGADRGPGSVPVGAHG